jgi:hypothetical protein
MRALDSQTNVFCAQHACRISVVRFRVANVGIRDGIAARSIHRANRNGMGKERVKYP